MKKTFARICHDVYKFATVKYILLADTLQQKPMIGSSPLTAHPSTTLTLSSVTWRRSAHLGSCFVSICGHTDGGVRCVLLGWWIHSLPLRWAVQTVWRCLRALWEYIYIRSILYIQMEGHFIQYFNSRVHGTSLCTVSH